jgi:predicted transcriptional regulator
MLNSESKTPSLGDILKSISDEKTLDLFNSIAVTEGNRSAMSKKVKLTSKQYYFRISRLTDAGLIKRNKGKYSLTLLGRVVHDSKTIIGKALSYYSKLKTLESIKMSYGEAIPKEELSQLINTFIDNYQIKDMLMKSVSVDVIKGETRPRLVKQ